MELKEILERQKHLFQQGVTRDLALRRKLLQLLRESIREHEDDILDALHQDLGKDRVEGFTTELGMVYTEISYMLRNLNRLARPKKTGTSLLNFPSKSTIYTEPYGTVLIMSPWNYPFQLTMVPLVGALAAGNCAVVKPSNYSPAVSAVIKEILDETFSDGIVYTVTGGREVNQHLLEEKFDYIFFTGGKAVGRKVMEAAAKHLTPVTLELGGKSPCIVDETADIALAARRIVWGKFLNCGQTCVAPDYVLVHQSVKDKLMEAMVRNIEALYGEEPLESKDYGKIINQKHFDRLTGILAGETPYYYGGIDADACKIGPMILDEADWDMKAMEEEIFGPILPVIAYESFAEVKKKIQERPKPLALYYFTRSKKKADLVIQQLSFGGGCINDTVMHLVSDQMPFGGVGESGMGGYHGSHSFKTFSHQKSVLSKSTLIDVPLRYAPYGSSLKIFKTLMK